MTIKRAALSGMSIGVPRCQRWRKQETPSPPAYRRSTSAGAVRQHGALVDRALVGDLAAVDAAARPAPARARGWRCRCRRPLAVDQALEELVHLGRRQPAAGTPAGSRRRRGRRPGGKNRMPISSRFSRRPPRPPAPGVAGSDDLACARRPTLTKVPVDELEVLGGAAVEGRPAAGSAGSIGDRVAGLQ